VSTPERLAAELLAVANGLRNVRTALAKLVAEDKLPAASHPETYTTMICGLDVAGALERLAQRLAETK
jgi:hypothetical protein